MAITTAAAILGAGAISAGVGAAASRSAANTQANAANRATDTQAQMFERTREDQRPWREAGGTSLGSIMGGFGLGDASGGVGSGYFSHQFGPEDLERGLAPNFEFMRDIGSKSVQSAANAMGGLGGNSLTEIMKWNQGFAQNAYQQAFNNYTSNQTNIFNRLASIAGLGQTAGANAATGGSQYAQGIAGSIQGAGNAQAAGRMGVANALGGGLNNAASWYYLNNLMGGGSGGGNAAGGVTAPAGTWGGS